MTARDTFGSGITTSRETIDTCDHYGLQADAFVRAARGEQVWEFPIEDAVQMMRLIEQVLEANQSEGK